MDIIICCNDMLKSGHLPPDLWLLVWASMSVVAGSWGWRHDADGRAGESSQRLKVTIRDDF